MNARNEQGLFGALERELRKAKEPIDCVTLFEKPGIREHAATANRVSDYLGNMWRKGLVLRLPAPRLADTRSRWLYVWKDKGPPKKPVIDMSMAMEFIEGVDSVINRPNMSVTEEGDTVVITLQHITIRIEKNK